MKIVLIILLVSSMLLISGCVGIYKMGSFKRLGEGGNGIIETPRMGEPGSEQIRMPPEDLNERYNRGNYSSY